MQVRLRRQVVGVRIIERQERGAHTQRVHAARAADRTPQRILDRARQVASGGELELQVAELARVRELAVPQQIRGLFERRFTNELADVVAPDDETAALAIHLAQCGCVGDHALETALDHCSCLHCPAPERPR